MFANHSLSNADRARAGWGSTLPAWVKLLAEACDREGQTRVATRLGKSGGYVSRVLRREYAGSYPEAETLVRARLGAERVSCPAWSHDIPLSSCVRMRRRKGPPANLAHQIHARVCPTCPRNTDRQED